MGSPRSSITATWFDRTTASATLPQDGAGGAGITACAHDDQIRSQSVSCFGDRLRHVPKDDLGLD